MKSLENRIPPPILVLIVGSLMAIAKWQLPEENLFGRLYLPMLGILGVLGTGIGLLAFLAFGQAKTTIDPVNLERASTLVTKGVYRFTRNPMYLALTTLLLTWAGYLDFKWVFLGPLAFVFSSIAFKSFQRRRSWERNLAENIQHIAGECADGFKQSQITPDRSSTMPFTLGATAKPTVLPTLHHGES